MVEPQSKTTLDSLLLALTFAAGYIDALSYLGLERVFTANMTETSLRSPQPYFDHLKGHTTITD